MYNLRRTKSRNASMKSRSNSSIKVDDTNPKDNQSQQSDYRISKYESEYISLSKLEHQENEVDKKLKTLMILQNQFLLTTIFMEKRMIAITWLNMIKILTKLKN